MSVRVLLCALLAFGANCGSSSDGPNVAPPETPPDSNPPVSSVACDTDNGGLHLPAGFCASVFADRVGAPRHIAVSASGDVYTMLSGGAVHRIEQSRERVRPPLRREGGGHSSSSPHSLTMLLILAFVVGSILRYCR